MTKAPGLFLLTLLSLPLAGQLTAPKIGTLRYADGSLHSVQGLPNNMIVCDLPFDNVDAASFSDKGGLVVRQGVLRLLGPDFSVVSEYDSGEAAPLLNMDGDLTSALAWLPSKHLLLHWDGSEFAAVTIAEPDVNGKVINLQWSGAKQARLLVVNADESVSAITFSVRNGRLVSSEILPGVHRYAFSQSFFFIYSDKKQIVADSMRGYRRSVALPADDLLIERMSSSWLHLYSPSLKQDWALHLTQADLEVSMLPANAALSALPMSQSRTAGEVK